MKKYKFAAMTLATVAAVAIAIPASAQTVNTSVNANISAIMARPAGPRGQMEMGGGNMKPGVFGTVSAVNGNTITVLGHSGFGKESATTTFTIDATNAKVTKSNTANTVSSIAVGDTVMAQGTLTGNNLVATMIHDGVMGGPGIRRVGPNGQERMASSTSTFSGNGEPIVAGTVSSVSGSTISVTNKSSVVYTVDATNAKILRGNATVDISTVKTGDTVVVQGTINGNSVTASSVMDQTKPGDADAGSTHPAGGFFRGVGKFFMHLFGF